MVFFVACVCVILTAQLGDKQYRLLWSICGCLLVSLVVVFFYYYRRWRSKEMAGATGGAGATGDAIKRFRKRDKMLFYGRRMLRKVKSISNSGQGRKRRAVMRFARKLLQLKKETAPEQLKVLEPPAEYLEEDLTSDDRVPPDALYMLHSIRVFGHFEKPVFLMLCKHTEILNLPAGAFLFKVGDTDENVYVVQNGRVNVYITNQDGSSLSLKVVRAGESVTSLLSFTDVLTGHSQPYKTVNAKALEDSQVIKLPMRAFQEVFKEYPDIFVRVIQAPFKLPEMAGATGGAGATGDAIKRFRKRDKMLFYGRRMLRKVKSISNSGQGRKRRAVMRFARKLLQLKKETAPEQLKVLEPPAEYLEEDLTSDDRVPPDALYMLHSIRVFGHFEKPVFLMLCKHTEILNLPAGAFLFKVGDTDENVYVVQNGRVNVYITNQDGSSLSLKVVRAGESVTSLLSFTDVLTGHSQPYKTVNAKALEDSQVIKLPMRAFQEVFKEYPDIFVRVIQIIMVRLQRVTFTALHQYLGLSAELVNPGREKRRPNTVASSPGKTAKMTNVESGGNMHSPHHSERAMSEHLEGNHASSSPIHIQGRRQKPDMVPDIATNTPQQPDVQPTPSLQRAREGSSFKKHNTDNLDEQALIQIATEAFVKELGLDSDTVLRGNVQVRDLPAGTYIMKEESHKDVALVYLLSGALLVSQRVAEGEGEVHMFTAYPGEVEGGLAVLTGEPSFFSIRAKHFSRIGLLSKTTVYSIMRERPSVVLHIANTVVRRLSPFVRQVDFALDWVFLESGRAVYRQDEESGSTFIVLSGRLRSVITHPNGKKELVGEYGKGDLVGIVEMVTQTRRSTTVMAVRDSELAKLPEGLFNAIKLRFPVVDVALVYLLSGALLVSQRVAEGEGEVHMFTAYPGEVEGGLAVLTGEPSFFSIRAKHFSRIGLLSKTTVYSIMRERPSVVLHIANTVVRRLSPFVRQVDFALDWVFLESGRAVYRQDEESGSTFIVLSGRLRSVITHPNGKKELVGEYGKGDLVGIVEMVTQTRRSTTVMAVRDSELAKLPEGLFNAIKLRFPVVVTRLINLLGHRILGSWQKPTAGLGGAAAIEPRPSQHNFSTVAVVPVSDDVPLTAFTYELYHSLSAIGPTVRLTSDVIRKLLGLTIMDPNNEYRLSSWLAQQEDKHKVALYQCDPSLTQWTQRCIRQADCILIVALGDKQPSIGKIEKEIERLAIRTQKELVLLHREGGVNPSGTVHWLNMRTWVSQHHHVRCPHRMFTRKSQYRIVSLLW
uniref:lysophospholipase n=1 Tax=Heliothis virescens TaxID=7102 RepID=A0A2A4JLR8_HELVI